jgi:quercetin dioxygenase-like cupin family protein
MTCDDRGTTIAGQHEGAASMSTAVATVQVDNERTRVTRWQFAPGDETGVHIHEYDYCVVPLLDGELTIVDPDGQQTNAPLSAGTSYFRQQGVHHNVINSNSFDYCFVEIEFK